MPTTVTTPADLAKVDTRLRAVEVKVAELPAGGGEPGTGYDDTLLVAAQQRLEARTTVVEGAVTQLAARVGGVEAEQVEDEATDRELRALIAELQSRVDDDEDEEARARIAALEARPTGTGGSTGALGSVMTPFITFGANDTERFINLQAKEKAGWKGEVLFESRVHDCPIQLLTLTDRRWVGSGARAGEWNNGTTINYTGPAGTSMFVLYSNPGYSYPANGVSRNANYVGIQWRGGSDRDFLPQAPAGYDPQFVQWYWQFKDCGWSGWRRVINGWGTGLDLTGMTHLQAFADTPLKAGGSECKWFLGGGLMDSDNAAWKAAGKPMIDCSLDKSVVGSVMLSARASSYQLRVTYGSGTRFIGTEFDAPDGNPTQGHQVRFKGTARTFNLLGDSFKGGEGILCESGPTEVGVDSCTFHGNRGLARCEAAFTGVLLWGLTNTYGECPRVIQVARGNQVISADPRVKVTSLDGTLVGIRNPDGTYTSATRKNSDGTTSTVPF